MIADLRKGWCPGALRPMPAKDGLLVRLRLTGGILTAANGRALADLAERCGSGLLDVSGRGNLQMRGVREDVLQRLQDGLLTLGLLDADAEAEAVRNVIASPLAGLHDGLDIRPLAAALERRLVNDARLHALPGKFAFLIDDGSQPSLAHVDADVRFDWDGEGFAIGLGGARGNVASVGWCIATELVQEATRIAKLFLELSTCTPSIRRMRDLGMDNLRDTFRAMSSAACGRREETHSIVGQHTFAAMPILGLAAPFGRLDAAMLRGAARLAETTNVRELRLTPWRVILVPGATTETNLPGFITDTADPRLAVAACVGADGCSRGTTHTQHDAARLARDLQLDAHDGVTLHVSGCAKGCAKASAAPITLVAENGRYGIVRDGRAGDPPWRRGLDLDEVRRALSKLTEPA